MSQMYDVVVVGAGMIGASMALTLAQQGLSVALVDAEAHSVRPLTAYEPRVVALTHASEQLLSQLGVWSSILAQRVAPYQQMYVWDALSHGEVAFDCAQMNLPNLGHIVENQAIINALHGRIQEQGQVSLLLGQPVQAIGRSAEGTPVVNLPRQSLTAKLVIGADGGNSSVRRALGFALTQRSYQQQALVAVIRTEQPHQSTAWQRFTADGPLAFLPLADAQHCAIVWSASEQTIATAKAADEADFNQQLATAFGYKLGETQLVGARQSFPLVMRHAQQYIQPGVALVGDAAHTIHPLAGQGANLGMLDVHVLSQEIARALTRGRPWWTADVLGRYQRQRKADNQRMIMAMDGFKWAFADHVSPVPFLRGMAMQGVNRLDTVKQFFATQALALPQLAANA